jgi:hypothetical protein
MLPWFPISRSPKLDGDLTGREWLVVLAIAVVIFGGPVLLWLWLN